MKNILTKYYIALFYFCSTFILFAQPGGGNDTNDLEGTDAPAAPIDNYIWAIAFIGFLYVFIKLRAFQNKKRLD